MLRYLQPAVTTVAVVVVVSLAKELKASWKQLVTTASPSNSQGGWWTMP